MVFQYCHSSPNYINSIIKIINEENIQAIYVGSDQELLIIGNAKEYIERETEAIVLSNPIEVMIIAKDKWKTFEFLNTNNLPYALSSLPEGNNKFIQDRFSLSCKAQGRIWFTAFLCSK